MEVMFRGPVAMYGFDARAAFVAQKRGCRRAAFYRTVPANRRRHSDG